MSDKARITDADGNPIVIEQETTFSARWGAAPMGVLMGDPIPPGRLTAARHNQQQRLIAALRAVLAPLLDKPFIDGPGQDAEWTECRFCGAVDEGIYAGPHETDCPVRRRDELLGR